MAARAGAAAGPGCCQTLMPQSWHGSHGSC
jgi:hypothetical protein